MKDRTTTWLASGLWLLGLALAVAGGVLQFLTRDTEVEFYGLRGFQGPFGMVIAVVGWLIATRRRGNPIGWIFLGAGFISCLQSFDSGYATYSYAEHGGTLPLTDIVVWLSVWIWVLITGALATHVLLLFPEGRLETRRQRGVAILAAVAILAFGIAIALTPGQAGETPAGVDNPYALTEAQAEPLTAIGGMLFIASVLASVAVLVARFRRSTGDLRQQMKWLTYAAAIAAVAISASIWYLNSTGASQSGFARVTAIGVIVGFAGIPVAAGIAVLRYGLYEIDVVINKTIVYAALAVFITVVYLAIVVGVGALVGAGDEPNTGLTIAATAIIAIAFQPVRSRAHHLANRLVFGKRSTPYEALSEFSARLSGGIATDDVLPRLALLMTEATAADRASVWLAVGAELHAAGSWPHDGQLEPVALSGEAIAIPGSGHVYPVRHEGELLGALALSTPPNEPLNQSEERLIADLAAQAGLLLRNARLIAELRASRQRLVAAQDLERRRIERNLHDGAQQHLVALAVNLRLARQMLERDVAQVPDMIEKLQGDATEALENLRTLAHGIYPPVLAERGLVAALQSQAAKAPLPVTVEASDVARYPQEVEAAVYFCVLEALQNIGKYAGATQATVRLEAAADGLTFTVTDDGMGFDQRAVAKGAGLTNMADRLDALGGLLTVRSVPGAGTTIGGSLDSPPVP